MLNPNEGSLHVCRFENFEKAEEAFIYDLIETLYIENKEFSRNAGCQDALPSMQQRFTLGHYIDPNHQSLLLLQNIYSHLTCEDLNIDSLGKEKFYSTAFERALKFLPNLSRQDFDERPASIVCECIQCFLKTEIEEFPHNSNFGKSDFLLPLNYFDYLEVDQLEIAEQMTSQVFDALGPGLSDFETSD